MNKRRRYKAKRRRRMTRRWQASLQQARQRAIDLYFNFDPDVDLDVRRKYVWDKHEMNG